MCSQVNTDNPLPPAVNISLAASAEVFFHDTGTQFSPRARLILSDPVLFNFLSFLSMALGYLSVQTRVFKFVEFPFKVL